MKFVTWVIYRKLSSKREFVDNRRGDSHNLLNGKNEFLLLISILGHRFAKHLLQETACCPSTTVSFVKVGTVKAILYTRAQTKFCWHHLHFSSDFRRTLKDLRAMPLMSYELPHNKPCSEKGTSLKDVTQISTYFLHFTPDQGKTW
jgi:hypothetical protein